MDSNTQTALIGAGISTALYTLLKAIKHYYYHYYLKSECHNGKELVISIEPKTDVIVNKEEEHKTEIELQNVISKI